MTTLTPINTSGIIDDNLYSTGDKPIKFIVNDFNTPSALPLPVVGNIRGGINVSSEIERPVPTYAGRKDVSGGFILPYTTTPDYGVQSGVNPIDTTNDLILKTGLTLREKKSGKDTSSRAYDVYGDASVSPLIVQNAGQFYDSSIMNTKGNEPGFNRDINLMANGIGVIWPEGQQCGISSRGLMQNINS